MLPLQNLPLSALQIISPSEVALRGGLVEFVEFVELLIGIVAFLGQSSGKLWHQFQVESCMQLYQSLAHLRYSDEFISHFSGLIAQRDVIIFPPGQSMGPITGSAHILVQSELHIECNPVCHLTDSGS